jgi:putative peptidoglycan lipid II flippase
MFPIGLVGVSLSIATMPVVSRHASKGDMHKLKEAYVSSTVLSLIFSLPATFGLIFLSQPIIRVIFEHGNFTPYDTVNTASALSLYAVGLFAYSALKIIVPVFYSLNKTRYPVMGSFITVFFNICIVMLSIHEFQHRAIALSTALCITVNFFFLSVMLYRQIRGYDVGYLLMCLVKILPVSLMMGLGAAWINRWCLSAFASIPLSGLISLFVAIAVGIIFYGAVISASGIKEVTDIRDKIIPKICSVFLRR